MRAANVAATVALRTLASFSGAAMAQTADPGAGYSVAHFFKVPPAQTAAFLDHQQGVMKKIAEARIAAGDRSGWTLFSVGGAGMAGEYNFVAVSSGDKPFDPMTGPDQWQTLLAAAGSKRDFSSVSQFLQPLTVRSIISRRHMAVGGALKPGAAVAIRRIRVLPGKLGAALAEHRNIMLPIAQELAAQGAILSHR
ncbi:MAG: hypothetical protein ACKV22_28875 [Bryobacteraceae bacterium]